MEVGISSSSSSNSEAQHTTRKLCLSPRPLVIPNWYHMSRWKLCPSIPRKSRHSVISRHSPSVLPIRLPSWRRIVLRSLAYPCAREWTETSHRPRNKIPKSIPEKARRVPRPIQVSVTPNHYHLCINTGCCLLYTPDCARVPVDA